MNGEVLVRMSERRNREREREKERERERERGRERERAAAGFKVKIGGLSLKEDMERLRIIREVIGDDKEPWTACILGVWVERFGTQS